MTTLVSELCNRMAVAHGASRGRSLRWSIELIGLAAVLAPAIYVLGLTRKHRFQRPNEVPPRPAAIVFGAGLRPDGSLMPMLADRLCLAISLYRQGTVSALLLSGDGGLTGDADEVSAMRQFALAREIPESDLLCDPGGVNTYASCRRAGEFFGLEGAVLVTQRFHLPRAVYIARSLGLDAVGIGARDWGAYGIRVMTRYTIREYLALVHAIWISLFKHRPLANWPALDTSFKRISAALAAPGGRRGVR